MSIMMDERYDFEDDWEDDLEEDFYPEDDYDQEYVNVDDDNDDDIEFEVVRLIEKIQHTRKVYEMTPVDRIILDILEETLELL